MTTVLGAPPRRLCTRSVITCPCFPRSECAASQADHEHRHRDRGDEVVGKNWSRGGTWTPTEGRELSLRPCPHKDCPERLRGGQGFASHVLLVPETEMGHGVICPACRRLPVLAMTHVRFPANYLRPWRGRFGYASHSGARDHKFSHIDPTFPDPGPAAALPDTGTLPRRETAVSKPGNYASKQLQNQPMRGERVLLLDLCDETYPEVAAEVERLGGRLAAKVTTSLSYVVVSDHRDATRHPKATRATAMDAKVLTLSQFRALASADWSLDVATAS